MKKTTTTTTMTVKFIEDDGRKWYEITGHDYIDDGEYALKNDGTILDSDGAQIDQRMQVHFDIIKDQLSKDQSIIDKFISEFNERFSRLSIISHECKQRNPTSSCTYNEIMTWTDEWIIKNHIDINLSRKLKALIESNYSTPRERENFYKKFFVKNEQRDLTKFVKSDLGNPWKPSRDKLSKLSDN